MAVELVKFPLQIYSYNKGCDWYDLTLAELETKCCIYGASLYWLNTIPVEKEPLVDTFRPTLYDIYNYDSSYWWEWPADLKKQVEHAYHKKEPCYSEQNAEAS